MSAPGAVARVLARAWPWWLLLLLVGMGMFKPVHMDDPAFLRVARQVRSFPQDPYGFQWEYLGEPTSALVGMPHPPLFPMLLGLGIEVVGEKVPLLHLLNAMLMLALLGGLHRLFDTPIRSSRAAWVVLVSPVALVLSHNLMSDFAALCLGVAGLGAWAEAARRGSLRGALVAGMWLAAAVWTRYPCLLLLPLPLLWNDLAPHRRIRRLLACGLPLFAFLGLCVWTLELYGEVHILAVLGYIRLEDTREPALRLLSFLPSLAVLAPALLIALPQRRWGWLGGAALAGALLGWWGAGLSSAAHGIRYDGLHTALLIALSAAGAVLLAAAWFSGRSRLARGWLLLAVGGIALATPSGAARYALPLLPVLLWCSRDALNALGRRRWIGAIGVQGLMALLLAGTDLRAALAVARAVPGELPRVSLASGRPVWVRGELAFRYYLEDAGARYLDARDQRPRAGDLLLRSAAATPAASRYVERVAAAIPVHPEAAVALVDSWPLRLHHAYAGAGFYGHKAGLLPFAFSRVPHDRIEVLRLRALEGFLDLARAERLGVDGPDMAREFERYCRVRNQSPSALEEERAALCLVARAELGGRMALRFPVALGDRRYLRGSWAEPARLAGEGVPGPATVGLVRVYARDEGGEAIEIQRIFRSRAEESQRRWFPLELDLAPLRDRAVWVELSCQVPEDAPERSVAYLIVTELDLHVE